MPEEQVKKMAASNMSLAIIEANLKVLKGMKKGWDTMTEFEKRDVTNQLDSVIKNEITKAVDIIVADKRVTLKAQVDQVVFKDGCKIVLKAASTESALQLADAQGNSVLVIITGVEKFKSEAPPKPDKDQKPLALDPKKEGGPAGVKKDKRSKRSGKGSAGPTKH